MLFISWGIYIRGFHHSETCVKTNTKISLQHRMLWLFSLMPVVFSVEFIGPFFLHDIQFRTDKFSIFRKYIYQLRQLIVYLDFLSDIRWLVAKIIIIDQVETCDTISLTLISSLANKALYNFCLLGLWKSRLYLGRLYFFLPLGFKIYNVMVGPFRRLVD